MGDENRVAVELVVSPKGLELFDQAGKKVGEFSAATGKASGLIKEALDGVRKGIEEEIEAFKRSEQGHKALGSSFSSLGAKIIELNQAWEIASRVAQAAGSAIQGVFAGINRGADLDDLSQRLGVAVEQLSSLELSAKLGGVSMEAMGTGLQILSRNMVEAASGGKQAQAAFEAVGISAADIANLRTDEVLERIADRFAGARDGADKTALAMDLLGKSGASLIPVLNAGGDGLAKQAELARQLGLVLDGETAQAMGNTADAVDILGMAVTGVQNQLASGMSPALSHAADMVIDFVANVGIADGRLQDLGRVIGTTVADSIESLIALVDRLSTAASEGRFGEALLEELQKVGPTVEPIARDIGIKIGGWIAEGVKSAFRIDWGALMEGAAAAGPTSDPFVEWANSRKQAIEGAFDVDIAPLTSSVDGVAGAFGRLQQAEAGAAAQTAAANTAFSSTHEVIGQMADGTLILGKNLVESGEAAKKGAIGYQQGGDAAKKAADEIEKLRDRFEEQIRTQTEAVEKMEGQNEALQQIIDGNLSAADAQTVLNDATGEAAAVAALATDATAEEAVALGNLAIRAAEAAQKNRELQATRNAQAQTQYLAQEAAILQQVVAGTKSLAEAEREIAILKERAKGTDAERAEALVAATERAGELRDTIKEMDEDVIHLGDIFKDSFEQAFDAVISGTRDMGDVLQGIGIGIGKRFFSAMLESKLKDFDPTVKANFLDLAEFGKSVFGDLFSGAAGSGGGVGGGSGAGGSLLSLFTGGGGAAGGGLSLGTLLSIAAPGIGAGANYGTAGVLTGLGAQAAYSLFGKFAISNLGQDALALLGGETFAGTLGDFFGNSATTWGGSLFGGGSVAGTFGGGAIGGAVGGLVSAGLNYGASVAGSATRDAIGVAGPYGTEGAILQTIGNVVAGIVGTYFGGPLLGAVLVYLNEILGPLSGELFGVAQPPTKGTMQRQVGESYLDAVPTFDTLQDSLGDVTRKFYRVEDAPWLPDSRAALGEDAMRDISGFAGIFAQIMGGDVDGGGRVAGMVEEWTNILTDFFGRMDQEGEETGLAIRQHLAQAFREMGVDATDAMEIVNKLGANLLFAGGATDVNYFGEQVSNVTNLGEAVRGTAAIFESELPPGIHIAALALESMSRDGEKAFADLDTNGRETLVNLAEDAENFDKILAHLFEQGFTIDTEEFEARLEAITQSATFLGENLGTIFNFDSAAAGVEAIFQQLKSDIFQTFQATSMEQLFGGTNIAAAFEPVYAALARIDEFDLTTATGAQDFMAILTPALAEGKANLQDYLPILQVMIDNWKEIQKIIDEAMKPDVFEQAALVAEEAFNGIGGALSTAIEVGLAVLNDGGTWDDAVNAFNGAFGAGIEKTFKDAIFNAIVQSALVEPLIARYQPAFQYVVAAGMIHGFKDPRVKEALEIVMGQARRDAEELGLAIFTVAVDNEALTSDIERAFNDAADITLDWANDVRGLLSTALDAAFDVLRAGGSREAALAAWSDSLGDGTEAGITDGIIRALVNAAIIEPFIKQWAPIIQYWVAAGLAIDPNDPEAQRRFREAGEMLFGPDSVFQQGLNNIPGVAIDWYWNYIGGGDPPPGANDGTGGLDLDGSQSGTGGRRSPAGRTFPGAATGGSFPIGQTLIVGENGPELLMSGPDGIEIVPLSEAQASALLDPASTQGRGLPDGGRSFPTNPPTGGGRDNGSPIGLNPNERRRQFPNPTSRPKVPPPPGGRPGTSGLSTIDVEIDLNLDDAIETFLRGGSLKDFREALEEGSKAAVIDGLVKGMLESGPIKKAIDDFNAQMSDAVEKAMRDGVIDAQEQADLDALGVKLSGSIETAAKAMQPVVESVGKALGIGMEQAAEEAAGSVSASLDGAIRTFLSGGSVEDMEDAVNQAIYDATTSGIIEALLTTGPLAAVIDKFGAKVGKAISDALEDGEIDEKEARRIRRIGKRYGGEISEAIKALGPVLGPLFEEWAGELGLDLKNEIVSIEGLLSGSVRQALLDGSSFGVFQQNVKQALYESIVDGMVQAFIDSAVINGLLAGPLGVINATFAQIADGQLTVAEANKIIFQQIGVITGLLDSPAFKAAWDVINTGIEGIRSSLGIATSTVVDVAQGFNEVANAAENACAGECEWERKLVESEEEKNATLDEFGRQGTETTESYSPVPKGPSAENEIDINDTLGGGDGVYGHPSDFIGYWERREIRQARRRNRRLNGPDAPDDDVPMGPPGNPPDDGRDFVGPNAATNGPMLVQDEGIAALRAEVASLRQAILNMPPPTVTLDGREISKSTRRHERRESRGGQSTQWGIS